MTGFVDIFMFCIESKVILREGADTGFPKKNDHFSIIKNISYLLNDDEEGKIM